MVAVCQSVFSATDEILVNH